MEVRLEILPPVAVIAHRSIGPYDRSAPAAWDELSDWVRAKGLWERVRGAYGYGLDDPSATPPEQIRYDACVALEGAVEPEADFEAKDLPGGRYAVWTMVGPYRGMPAAFGRLVGEWLPSSGQALDPTRPFLEIYLDDPSEVPESELRTDLCLPIEG